MTESVALRRWTPADAADIAVMVDDPHLHHWSSLPGDLHGWLSAEAHETRGPARAICVTGDDHALGSITLRPPQTASEAVRCAAITAADQPAGELSYWLVPAARGRGLALAAVRLFLTEVVATTGLRTVVLDIEDDNHASARLAERLGAERRAPTRTERDRLGVTRTLVTHVLAVDPLVS